MTKVTVKRSVNDLLKSNGYTQNEFASVIGKSLTYISNRCTLKEPWTMDDVLFMSDFFGLSDEELLQYFGWYSKKGERKNV